MNAKQASEKILDFINANNEQSGGAESVFCLGILVGTINALGHQLELVRTLQNANCLMNAPKEKAAGSE